MEKTLAPLGPPPYPLPPSTPEPSPARHLRSPRTSGAGARRLLRHLWRQLKLALGVAAALATVIGTIYQIVHTSPKDSNHPPRPAPMTPAQRQPAVPRVTPAAPTPSLPSPAGEGGSAERETRKPKARAPEVEPRPEPESSQIPTRPVKELPQTNPKVATTSATSPDPAPPAPSSVELNPIEVMEPPNELKAPETPNEKLTDKVTVRARRGPERSMRLPETPGNPLLAGKKISFQVHVDSEGKATAHFLEASPGVAPFIIRGARDQIEQGRWIVALDPAGQPLEQHWRVIFRWLRPEEKRTAPVIDP